MMPISIATNPMNGRIVLIIICTALRPAW